MRFTLHPIGWIRKTKSHTRIVLYRKYQAGLMGVDKLPEIGVLWWFHRNGTQPMRSTLKVHPKGNPANPLTGVFRNTSADAAEFNRFESRQSAVGKK
jgi:tRNA (Thr-GGU) A37 N-methylase